MTYILNENDNERFIFEYFKVFKYQSLIFNGLQTSWSTTHGHYKTKEDAEKAIIISQDPLLKNEDGIEWFDYRIEINYCQCEINTKSTKEESVDIFINEINKNLKK